MNGSLPPLNGAVIDLLQTQLDAVAQALEQVVGLRGIAVFLLVQNADGAEELAVGPGQRQTAVRDHSQLDVRVVIPDRILQGVGHQQLALGAHDGFAVKPAIQRRLFAGLVNIALAVAAAKHLDFLLMHPHDQRRRNTGDLGQQVDCHLPARQYVFRNFDVVEDGIFWRDCGFCVHRHSLFCVVGLPPVF